MLDCSKSNKLLKWKSIWGINETIEKTINWYKDFYLEQKVNTQEDKYSYIENAKKQEIEWAK